MGDIDRKIEIEQARWQQRLEKVYCEYYPEVDGAGCDSGDPLDLTATEVELTCIHLQEQIAALRAENQRLRDTIQRANEQFKDLQRRSYREKTALEEKLRAEA